MDLIAVRDRLQGAFWLWPATGVAVGAIGGSVLGELRSLPGYADRPLRVARRS